MTRSPSFVGLGLDILINVITFLRAPDIICLRLTCKTLRASTEHRIVWLNALEQMMEEHHIPKATFPTDSMDRQGLEHIALSPAQFSSIIEKSSDSELHPRSIRTLPDHISKQELSKHGIVSVGGYRDMLLAPGGRFLVTSRIAPDYKTLVQLWDLGVCGYGNQEKNLVQSLLEETFLRLHSLSPIPDGTGFYLLSQKQSVPIAILVHKILAFGAFPSITGVNKRSIPSDIISYSISATRLTCVCGPSTVMVWDFEAQLSTSWDSHVEQDEDFPLSVHLYADIVLLYCSGSLMLWKIPDLRPDIQEASLQHRRLATFTAFFEDGEGTHSEDNTYLLIQSPWNCGRPGSEFLGIVNSPDFGLFRIQHLLPVQDDNIPTILHSRMAICRDFTIAGRTILTLPRLQICNHRLMVSALDGDNERMYIQMLPVLVDGSQIEPTPMKELVFRCRDMTPDSPQLCTATGRLCIMVGEDIEILDYLQSPQRF
ncbi:hypothetical protein GALMADRAFT_136452 [Galerina marginata CBS 339.88]|uniref:F-box domain-containing protein n=1 Tax=Galerina marginata (strain CBS 339.88) TaxID=685588 RepID=A0A067T9I4_GALM3|nr:hypothetical protein GALMADRAFT_136452 [Galerina marginata CBS 339.88]